MDGYIEFDNLPFKLAVAQVLMYDLKLLGEPYSGGDEYFKSTKTIMWRYPTRNA